MKGRRGKEGKNDVGEGDLSVRAGPQRRHRARTTARSVAGTLERFSLVVGTLIQGFRALLRRSHLFFSELEVEEIRHRGFPVTALLPSILISIHLWLHGEEPNKMAAVCSLLCLP